MMKKIVSLLAVFLILGIMLTGCSGVKVPTTGTNSEKYVYVFEQGANAQKTISQIADDILKADICKFPKQKKDVSAGTYLQGFNAKTMSGFTKGICVSSKVNATPFIAYIFETDDVAALKASLEENANMGWQICVIADEMAVSAVENKVFIVMCPSAK